MLPEVVIACVFIGLLLGAVAHAWSLVGVSVLLMVGLGAHALASGQEMIPATVHLILAVVSFQASYLAGALLLVPAARLICRGGFR